MKCPEVKRIAQWTWDGVVNNDRRRRCVAPLKPEATNFRNPAKYTDEGLDPSLCNNFAKYQVNGDDYCRKHAGMRVLDLCDPNVRDNEQ